MREWRDIEDQVGEVHMQNIALRIFVSTFSALVFGIVPVRA